MNSNNLKKLRDDFLLSGDWHVHTNYVHAAHTIEECILEGEKKKLELIVLVEHIRLNPTYSVSSYIDEINQMKEKSSLKILSGFEAKVINQDGELDISPEAKNNSDLIYGAFHSWFEPTIPNKEDYLAAIKSMLYRKEIDIWAHPFSFSAHNKISIEHDEIVEIVELAKKQDIIMEINLKHQTPTETVINIMLEHSVPFIISSDAHNKLDIWDKSKPDFIYDTTWNKIKYS